MPLRSFLLSLLLTVALLSAGCCRIPLCIEDFTECDCPGPCDDQGFASGGSSGRPPLFSRLRGHLDHYNEPTAVTPPLPRYHPVPTQPVFSPRDSYSSQPVPVQ